MGQPRRKAVINASVEHLAEIQSLVRRGRYRTVSEFAREAIAEKIERLRAEELVRQVERYCGEVRRDEDEDLVAAQALPEEKPRAKR